VAGPQGIQGQTGAIGANGAIGPEGPEGDPAGMFVQPNEPTVGSVEVPAEFWVDTDDDTGFLLDDNDDVDLSTPPATGDALVWNGSAWVPGAGGGGGGGATTILNGTATPTASTGKTGEYYLDADGQILYGPKQGLVYGPIPQPYVVGTSTDSNTGTSAVLTIAAPAGIQSGDMMVVYITDSYNGSDKIAFLRWTDVVTGTIAEMGAAVRFHQVVSRIYSPDDPGPYTFTMTGIHASVRKIGTMVAIRNVTPYDLHGLPIYNSPTDLSISMATPNVGPGLLVSSWGVTTGAPNRASVTTTNGTQIASRGVPDTTGTVSTNWQTVISKPVTSADALTITSPGPTLAAEANAAMIAKQLPAVTADEGYLNADVTDMLSRDVFYWAHRGGSDHWGEFTRLAYDECVKWGAPALELSLNRTSDGVWFGLHDEFLNRTSPGQGLPVGADPTTMTWAQVNALYNVTGNVVAKYLTLTEFLSRYKNTGSILILDAKYAYRTPAWQDELLGIVLAQWPANRIVGKGDLNNSGWANKCHALGIKTWGYLYSTNIGDLPTKHSPWDILGFEFDAPQSEWNTVLAYGKPVVGFLIADQTGADMALSKGAAGLQCTNVIKVIPRAALPAEVSDPWPIAIPAPTTDHGALTGLGDDDHPNYLTNTRGDARYAVINNAFPSRLWITADATNPAGSVDGDYRIRPA
jgi:hypothetical protein